ncbi:hypothetical protein OAK19_04195, partial [Aureispira]|nr:hypothetical protein [Aureispira sp.]
MRNEILLNLYKKILLFLIFSNIPLHLLAQNSLWEKIEESEIPNAGERYIVPTNYLTLKLDLKQMSKMLSKAPMTRTPEVISNPAFLDIPWPDGSMKT